MKIKKLMLKGQESSIQILICLVIPHFKIKMEKLGYIMLYCSFSHFSPHLKLCLLLSFVTFAFHPLYVKTFKALKDKIVVNQAKEKRIKANTLDFFKTNFELSSNQISNLKCTKGTHVTFHFLLVIYFYFL